MHIDTEYKRGHYYRNENSNQKEIQAFNINSPLQLVTALRFLSFLHTHTHTTWTAQHCGNIPDIIAKTRCDAASFTSSNQI